MVHARGPYIIGANMARILACDPGLSGALCFMIEGSIVDVMDVPTAEDGSNRQVDVMAVCRRIDQWKPRHAIIENVQPMPSIPGPGGVRRGMGAASSFRFGFATGQLRAVCVCYGLNLRLVHPRTWKKWAGLQGPDKEQSRQLALQLVPDAARWLSRKKDHGRAESVLLALYCKETLGML